MGTTGRRRTEGGFLEAGSILRRLYWNRALSKITARDRLCVFALRMGDGLEPFRGIKEQR